MKYLHKCWKCGKSQQMPPYVRIRCIKCNAICMYIPRVSKPVMIFKDFVFKKFYLPKILKKIDEERTKKCRDN